MLDSREGPPDPPGGDEWRPSNYINYFSEIEEHFQRARGTALFLLSPLDWALIETWRSGGVPLEAVLRGIDNAFEKWHRRKLRQRAVNSLAYCAQAVADAAQRAPSAARETAAPFPPEQLAAHLRRAATALKARPEPALAAMAVTLEEMAAAAPTLLETLEDLERRLTALEDKLVAVLRSAASEDDLYAMRQALDSELKPYRGSMSGDQLATLERRYLDTMLMERAQLPRLSLFYVATI